jgi:hypothetical protein
VAEPDRLQPGQPVAAVGVASTDRSLIADHFVAATAENQRAFDKARPILLAAPDGELPHMTAIHRHIAENHGAAGAGGIARGGGSGQVSARGIRAHARPAVCG